MSSVKEAALEYLKHGFSVIPVKKDKKPLLPSWLEFENRKPEIQEIDEWFKKYPDANIAIVTGAISNVSVVDIDSREGQREFLKFLPDYPVIPTANTPRGFWHLYFRTPDAPLGNNAGAITGVDFRGNGGYVVAPPSINSEGKGWEWQPGQSIFEVEPPPLPIEYYNKCIYYNRQCNAFATPQGKIITEGQRDETLFHLANTLIRGGMGRDECIQFLEMFAKTCNPPFPLNEVRAKVESALKRAERKGVNIAQEVFEFVSVASGCFSVSDCYLSLQTVAPNRNTIRNALHRLAKEGILERDKNRDGIFRRIDNEAEEIDFINASTESLWLHWPFGIERYVKTLPKNIIIIAGSPNAGKTAFLLNFIKQNMQDHEIHYFSSEMGSIEIRTRLEKFDIPLNDWRFTPKERSSNFADVIKPDAINIIDFLEIYDEFYKVGGMIKDIYEKLNKGIALIALQKNPNTDFGLGGMRSLEKARLYLAMESGKLKIVKAKNWQSSLNPNGLAIDFKLVQGCKFVCENDWGKA